MNTQQQESDDADAAGHDRFEGFDRGDLDRDHDADQNDMNEAEAEAWLAEEMNTAWVNPYHVTEPKRIDAERFEDMLGVMLPSRWSRSIGIESFHVCERLTGNLVSWFVRAGKSYWEFNDEATITLADIAAKITTATQAEAA